MFYTPGTTIARSEVIGVLSFGKRLVTMVVRGSALKADVAQQPRDLGAKTIEAISKHFAGSPVETSIAVPVKIVDANSLK